METRRPAYCLYPSTGPAKMCEYFLNFINILRFPLFFQMIIEFFLNSLKTG